MTEAKRVIVTGATGLIGSSLCRELITRGYAVVVFSRDPLAAQKVVPGAADYVGWQSGEEGWTAALDGAYAVVNLAGGSLYRSRQTRESVRSETQHRVKAIQELVKAMKEAKGKPEVFVSASSVGTYGFDGLSDAEYTESSAPGSDFWGQDSLLWEEAARAAEAFGVRTVVLRFGYVLAMHAHSGLAQQVEQFRRGFGGAVGSGKQWQPWIHVADAAGLILFALQEDRVEGAVNGTAPDVVHNRDFAQTLGRVLGKPARLKLPGLFLRMGLGVTADTILYGRRVLPQKALDLGYQFQFPTLEPALQNLVEAAQ